MKVLLIGSGGREHALCESLKRSRKIIKVYCFPGNAGTENIAENINVDLNNFEKLKNIILEKKIEIVVIGPEKPLVDGLADYLEKYKIKVLVQVKLPHNLKDQKFLQKIYVQNMVFQLQILESIQQKKMRFLLLKIVNILLL